MTNVDESSSFEDKHGRTWCCAVTPYEYSLVKQQLDFDCYDIVLRNNEGDKDKAHEAFAKSIERLETDDMFLSRLLYLCCKEEADQREVGQEDFVRSMDGSSLNRGLSAFLFALSFFFREEAYTTLVKRLRSAMITAKKEANIQAIQELDKSLSPEKPSSDSVGPSPQSSGTSPLDDGNTITASYF